MRKLLTPGALDTVGLASRVAVYVAFALCIAITAHLYFRIIGHAPYLAVDDALANISVVLSNLGRYGLLAYPLQGPGDAVRTHGFYNYGPFPFYIGAALDWLFGTSWVVQRSLHLLCVVALGLLSLVSFRRDSLAAGGLYMALAVWLLWSLQWPMFRPDPVVALFAGLGAAALTWAVASGRPAAWAAAGFCIATAVSTHQIAWALIPGAAVVWLAAEWLNHKDARSGLVAFRPGRSLAAAVIGALAGFLIYAVAIEFRFADLLKFYSHYLSTVEGRQRSGWETYLAHFEVAWSGLAPAWLLLLFSLCGAGGALLVLSPFLEAEVRRRVLSLLLPAFVLWVAYQAGLATFKNTHRGYVILWHMTTCWLIAATLASALVVIRSRERQFARGAEVAGRVAVGFALVFAASSPASHYFAAARRNVGIDDYQYNVLSIIPQGAVVWGDGVFGLRSGTKYQLHETFEAAHYASLWSPEARAQIAPQFLVMNNVLKELTYQFVTRGPSRGLPKDDKARIFKDLLDLFPGEDFKLANIVVAPPYGTSRVYGRRATPPEQVLVAVYDVRTGEWKRGLGAPIPFRPQATDPVVFDLSLYKRSINPADRSVAVELPPGDYLISVRIHNPSPRDHGLIAATSVKQFTQSVVDLGYDMGQAVYRPTESLVQLVARHPGGALYVSQFDSNPAASFEMTEVRPIGSAAAYSNPLPPLEQWRVLAPKGRRDKIGDELAVTGDASANGYQLLSPPVPVAQGSRVQAELAARASNGKVAVGVLDRNQERILAQSDTGELSFEVGPNEHIYFLVYNDNKTDLPEPVRFTVSSGRLHLVSSSLYIDLLTSCREWVDKVQAKPSHCR